jgi:phage tail sheath protein FI
LLISSKEDLDNIYFGGPDAGPTNPAERYFYNAAAEILNSPATLYTTRLPYGSGTGVGFDGEYTALCYSMAKTGLTPVLTATVTDELVFTSSSATSANVAFAGFLPTFIADINKLSVNGVPTPSFYIGSAVGSYAPEFTSLSSSVIGSTGAWTLTSNVSISANKIFATYNYTYSNETMFQTTTSLEIGAPTVIPLTESQYEDLQVNNITWNATAGQAVTGIGNIGNAGMIIVNKGKTTIDEKQEGYYVVVADNSTMKDNILSGYNSILGVNTFKSNTTVLSPLASSVLGFTLTGDSNSNGSISQVVETAFPYDFSDPTFDDSLIVYVFRLRTSVYADDPNKLYFTPVERFAGGLMATDLRTDAVTKTTQSFYIADKVKTDSTYLNMYVNPNIAEIGNVKEVINTDADKVLNPLGNYKPCKKTDSVATYTGDIPKKLDRALLLVDSVLDMDIDLVLDGGLSTIWTYTYDATPPGDMVFDDARNTVDIMGDLGNSTDGNLGPFASAHRTVYNIFNTFCQDTRKDCLHISDPVRGIFVQGQNSKTLDSKSRNFPQHVMTPLKNLYNGANSSYSCAYANWVQIYDASAKKYIWMPFSGYQAAIMAKLDSLLYPWAAPMGLNNGIVRSVTNIAVRTNQKQQDAIYKIGINPVVFFTGDGITVWGQKTLQTKPSAFDRINVRRLFLTLERATMKTMRYFVAEPNTVFTRTRVINTLKPLFDLAKNNEGVYDYLLICSEKNNTPQTIDNNELAVDIYLKPVRTAEFIICTFYATRTDANFKELAG